MKTIISCLVILQNSSSDYLAKGSSWLNMRLEGLWKCFLVTVNVFINESRYSKFELDFHLKVLNIFNG